MPDLALRERVVRIVAVVLGDDGVGGRSAGAEWDSLQQIEVVLAVEDEFGVVIPESLIGTLRSVDDVVAHLGGLGAAR